MKRDNTPWSPAQPATVEWHKSGTPESTLFQDTYYSRDNGLEESDYVFVAGNRLPQRWHNHPYRQFRIGETGFGTGLNFLLTWKAWRDCPEPRPDLHYVSFEKHPLAGDNILRALARWPDLQPFTNSLLQDYPGLTPGQHRLLLDKGRVRLDLWWEDAGAVLADCAGLEQQFIDAWYLDGFAPSRNDSMWTNAMFRAMAALSREGATFATFTAAGEVRRSLGEAGFDVSKAPGYGRKRERLIGTISRPAPRQPSPVTTPWDIPAVEQKVPDSAIVVGGGLAGCSAAAALARRGIRVTVLEQGALADAGSGNDQGILYTRLSRKHSPLVDFALQSYRLAATTYSNMFARDQLLAGVDGELCGYLQQSDNIDEMRFLQQVLPGAEDLARVLTPKDATVLLGLPQEKGGYWFPQSGWLRPAAVCRALLDDPRIQLVEHCGHVSLNHDGEYWQAAAQHNPITTASCVIIACGTGSSAFEQIDWLPLQSIRGQTTDIPSTPLLNQLRSALCHEGYIAPARHGYHCIGATFDPDSSHQSIEPDDHRINLERLCAALPACREEIAMLEPASLTGRVGFRCASPDYLPMVGPVPDYDAFIHDFDTLRKNAREHIDRRGCYLPGLYVSTAHGSRGLASTPLSAELLASMVCAEPPPLSRALVRALAPARFIIRDLCRNRLST